MAVNRHDAEYNRLIRQVLEKGHKRPDRTGTGTTSLFAPEPLRFDLRTSVPLLTTKRVPWKAVIKELLWFLRGDTDAKILQKEGVHIWDGNTSAEFLASRGLPYEEGLLGPGYGWQFRRFGATYDPAYADTSNLTDESKARLGGMDQIAYAENLLKTDPFSRRIYINLWNAAHLDAMALTPCHVSIQFYVTGSFPENRELSAQVYIRSNDLFLGNPFNIFSYAVLVYLMAKRHNMTPGDLIIVIGDAHIYNDHMDQVKEQLARSSYAEPQLVLNDRLAKVDWSEMTIADFQVNNYTCHPAIKANMSV